MLVAKFNPQGIVVVDDGILDAIRAGHVLEFVDCNRQEIVHHGLVGELVQQRERSAISTVPFAASGF